MDAIFVDWASLILRWFHVMAGIAWIGTSFFFVWLDMSLRAAPAAPPGVAGESWMVHGGGFYQAQKYVVAPAALPKELHWFKFEAYITWATGFLLMGIVYYLGAEQFLVDPAVMDLDAVQAIGLSIASLVVGWVVYDALCRALDAHTGVLAAAVLGLAAASAYGFTHAFSGRAAFLHVGALLGTIMVANVFFIIVPNQKKTVAALIAGQAPDPAPGRQAKQRSLHNNYLTLPVVLLMVSSHYPTLFQQPYGWLFVVGIVVASGFIRHYENLRDAGRKGNWIDWLPVYAAGIGFVLVAASFELSRPGESTLEGPPVALAEVVPIIENRCVSCHSATPSDRYFRSAPKGVAFDTPAEIEKYAAQILRVAVRTTAMPLGNRTGMQPEERALVGRWAIRAAE